MRRVLYGINSVLFLDHCPSQGSKIKFLLLISFQPIINGQIALYKHLKVVFYIRGSKAINTSKKTIFYLRNI
jgi:hypothetical protein